MTLLLPNTMLKTTGIPREAVKQTWCFGRETHYSLEDEFSHKVPFKAGNGLNVKFWHDL